MSHARQKIRSAAFLLTCICLGLPHVAWAEGVSRPKPANGAEGVNNRVTLTWNGSALWYQVIAGTDAATVDKAAAGEIVMDPQYTLSGLAECTTYYWRVDTLTAWGTIDVKGEVWSFSTKGCAPPPRVLMGWWKADDPNTAELLDASGNGLHGQAQGDPNWVDGMVGMAVALDGNDCFQTPAPQGSALTSATLSAWVFPTEFSMESKGLLMCTDNKTSGLYLKAKNELGYQWNGSSVAADFSTGFFVAPNEWSFVAAVISPSQAQLFYNEYTTIHSTTHAPAAFNSPLTVGADPRDPARYFQGRLDDIRLYTSALTPNELLDITRGEPTRAWQPFPLPEMELDRTMVTALSWQPGDGAVAHDVYLSTDRDAVAKAHSDTAGIYRRTQNQTQYPIDVLPGQTYYWRIDEVTQDGDVFRGTVWSFRVTETLIIDDFEGYTDFEPARVWDLWSDGYVNETGSAAGYWDPPYCEMGITHSGGRSLPFIYNRDQANPAPFSEVNIGLVGAQQNFTREGSTHLVFWLHGQAANTLQPGDKFYVVLDDSRLFLPPSVNTMLQEEDWQQISLELAQFNHPNLKQVRWITLGIGNPQKPSVSGAGTVWIDDIGLAANP